jgi:hypothetical protein
MFVTKNLSREQAEAAARAASVLSRRGHIVVQAMNGRYKWARMGFLAGTLAHILARRVWYVSVKGEVIQVK